MTVTYNIENPYEIKDELMPLHLEHYKDDHRKKETALSIDWEQYDEWFAEGKLTAVIAREDDDIVGYVTALVGCHQHNKDYAAASMDTLFVKDSHRKGGVATQLISNLEEFLIEQDVSWFSAGFRKEETAEGVLGKLGYSKIECTFGKSLRGK